MAHASVPSVLVAAACIAGSACSIVFVAVRLQRRIARDDRLLGMLIGTLLCLAQAVGIPLVLGMAGILSRFPVLVAHLCVAAAVVYFVRPAGDREPARSWTPLGLTGLALGTILIALSAAPTVRGIAPQASDTVAYHVVNMATWLQHHSIWPLPFQNPGFYTATHPGNGEMLGLWLTLPTHSDQLTYLGVIAFGLLTVLATAQLTRELGGDARWGALAGIAIVGAPMSFATQAHSLSTDLATTGTLVTAVALLLRATRVSERRDKIVLASLAGLATGFALGSKYTALIPAGLMIVWVVFWLRPRRAVWAFLPGLALFAAPWFVRNTLRTGNPLFPQDVRILGIHLLTGGTGPLDSLRTTILQHVRARHWDVVRRWARLGAHYWGFVPLFCAGVLAGVRRSPQRTARVVVGLLALAAFASYTVTPYTGAGPNGLSFLMGSNERYALTGVVLAAALFVSVVPSLLTGAVIALSVGYDGFQIVHGAGFRTDISVTRTTAAAALIVAVGAMVVASWPRIAERTRRSRESKQPPAYARPAFALLVGWLALSRLITHIDGASTPSFLERTVAAEARNAGGPIIVVGVNDVRSVLGSELGARIETLSAGTRGRSNPAKDGAALDQALRASGGSVLVIPATPGSVSVPKGWVPPAGWQLAGKDSQTAVYVLPSAPEASPTQVPGTPPVGGG